MKKESEIEDKVMNVWLVGVMSFWNLLVIGIGFIDKLNVRPNGVRNVLILGNSIILVLVICCYLSKYFYERRNKR